MLALPDDFAERGRGHAGAAHPQRVARLAAMLGAAVVALAACTETSLNEAPVIDRSVKSTHGVIVAPPGTAAATAAAGSDALYTVQKGDTIFRLASQANASVADLARWNGLAEGTPIYVGQQLRLHAPPVPGAVPAAAPDASAAAAPAPEEAVASAVPLIAGDGVQTRSLEPAVGMAGGAAVIPGAATAAAALPSSAPAAPESAPAAPAGALPSAPVPSPEVAGTLAPQASPAPAPTAAAGSTGSGWIWPVAGAVTRRFEPPRSKGIDIAVAEDAPVMAVADGTVLYTGSPRDYGKLVVVKHGEELLSVYAHNKSILVKEGQPVQRGQVLATAGTTGSGPAILHFEARRNRVTVDPLELLPPR